MIGSRIHRLVARATCAISIAGLSACAGDPTAADGRGASITRDRAADVVIAVAWPWDLRKEVRFDEGLQMAVDEINAAGGVGGRRVRIARFDDHESVDEGRLVAQRIAADPAIVAVVGHLQSYVTVPAATIYDRAGLVHVAPAATDPELTAKGFGRIFRMVLTDRAMGRQLADFAARSGYRRIAIEYIRNAYGRGLANAFEARGNELGLVVVARQSYDPSEQASSRTFVRTLHDWQGLELDAILLAGEVPSAGHFIAEARLQKIRAPVLGGDALGTPALLAIAGETAEVTVVATFFHPDEPRPEVRQFTESFRRRYGAAPDAGSALGYDAIRLLADAMQRAGSPAPDRVALALRAARQWKGVTGEFTFDERGDLVNRTLVTMIVRGGTFVRLADSRSATTTASRHP